MKLCYPRACKTHGEGAAIAEQGRGSVLLMLRELLGLVELAEQRLCYLMGRNSARFLPRGTEPMERVKSCG